MTFLIKNYRENEIENVYVYVHIYIYTHAHTLMFSTRLGISFPSLVKSIKKHPLLDDGEYFQCNNFLKVVETM